MKTERIRLFAILLAALLMVTMLPVAAFAVDGDEDPETPVIPAWEPNVKLVSYPDKSVRADKEFDFTLNLYCSPEDVAVIDFANDAYNSLTLSSSNFKGIDDSNTKVDYDLFDPTGNIIALTLTLKADKNLVTGTYQLPFYIKLRNKVTRETATIDFSSVYISVKTVLGSGESSEDEDEVDPVLTPHLVITSVSTAGQQLPKDENFSVTVNFKNTSKNIPLENIILTVAPGSGLTLPKASTNFYIEKIKAGETVSQTFTLYADDDAVTGAFSSLGVSFSYQYMANDAYIGGEDAESVSLFFGSEEEEESKEDRFDILDMQTPDYLYPNEENYLTFTIINKGSAPINNIMGKIESPALSNSGASEYFGQLAANTKDELELPMVAMQSGDVIGTVTITYELEDGTEKMIVRDFTAYAEEVYIDDPGEWIPEEPTTEETGGIKPYWYFIGGGVLAAAGLTAVLVRRAKKKKAMALADDEI